MAAAVSSGVTVIHEPSTSTVTETLTLRLVPRRKKKSVKWTEDTIDNEFAGKKSSKKCCIFHKRRQFGDWSDDDDSDQECGDPNCKSTNDKQSPDQLQQGMATAHQQPPTVTLVES